MDQWAAIRYGGFYDVPRTFMVSHEGQLFLFDSSFDDELDDYPDSYRVYLLPQTANADLAYYWGRLPGVATKFLGGVSVSHVQFDPTKRKAINPAILNELLAEFPTGSKNA